EPIILIECKHHAAPLSISNASQLFRYFHTTKAKFAILTNGIEYKFFTDLVETNKMDEKPFFHFDITEIKENQIEELKKFHKSQFDFEKIVNTASDLKYTNELKALINEEINNPSADFVRHFAKQIYPSIITQKVLDQFTGLVKNSFNQHFSDVVTDRLQTALNKETKINNSNLEDSETDLEDSKIITTKDELNAFVQQNVRQKELFTEMRNLISQSYLMITIENRFVDYILQIKDYKLEFLTKQKKK
ncbi:MAG: type I restriction enzyme HsdR N-terminal domain-containing protein, partial [Algoriella sp.]